ICSDTSTNKTARPFQKDMQWPLNPIINTGKKTWTKLHGKRHTCSDTGFSRPDAACLFVYLDDGFVSYYLDDFAHQPFVTDFAKVIHLCIQADSGDDRPSHTINFTFHFHRSTPTAC